jgi:hypothetical protein
MKPDFSYTLIKSDHKIGKQFELVAGELEKISLGDMTTGNFERRTVKNIDAFADSLNECTHHHAHCYGVFKGADSGKIVTVKQKPSNPGAFARCRDDMTWEGGGILFLDYDPPGEQSLTREELVSTIRSVCPWLADVKMLWKPSASSLIKNTATGKMLRELKGQRIYFAVDHACEIPRIGRLIYDRLWLAGQGRIDISKAGSALSRTLVDAAVWQPERLDFTGGAVCVPPLEQLPREGKIIPGNREYLATISVENLSADDSIKLSTIQRKADAKAEPAIKAARELWIDRKVKDTVPPKAEPACIERTRSVFRSACEESNLSGDFLLTHNSGKTVTVSDILTDPKKWHEETFFDPLEPVVDPRIAKLYLNPNGDVIINSFAHGSQKFRLIGELNAGDPDELRLRAEKVLLSSSNPCGTYDTSKLPPLMKSYIDHICATTDTEPITVTVSLLGLISGFLKKSVYIREDDYKSPSREVYFQQLHVNINALVVLGSGLYKTTAQNRACRIGYQKLEEIKKSVADVKMRGVGTSTEELKEAITALENQTPFLPQKTTAEGLLEVELKEGRSGTIFLSEFGAWLKSLQKTYNMDLKALFTDLYDVLPSFNMTSKGSGRVTIERPYVSICGLSTIDWVKEEIKTGDVSTGFFARFLLFNPPGKKIVPPAMPVRRPGMDENIEGQIRDILFNHVPIDRPYVLSQDAYERFNAIHAALYETFAKLPEEHQKLLEPYIKRWSPYILKLAMIMQFMTNPDTNEIGVDAILSGTSIVEYAIQSTIYLFQKELGESRHQEKCRHVLEYVARRTQDGKLTTWGNIISSNILKEGTKEYSIIVSHLVESGQLAEKPSTTKKEYRYTLGSVSRSQG